MDHIFNAVIATDREFRVRSWNRAAEHIYGWQAEEVLGRVVDEVLRTDFEPKKELALATLIAQGSVETEVTHYHRDGRKVRVQARVSLIRNAQGEPCGTVGVLREVMELQQAEAALRQSERRLQVSLTIDLLAF